jgi:hypothetical protein
MNFKFCFYVPLGLDGYELCHPVRKDDFERINIEVNGASRAEMWKPIAMHVIHEDQGHKYLRSDSPWLSSHALIFRSGAIIALGELLRLNGELLPLACSEADLVMYNPTKVLDALDEEASTLVRFDSGRIMMIRKYVFRSEVIEGIDVFKIPNLRASPTFLSQRFVNRWNESGLKGLEFKQVWASN